MTNPPAIASGEWVYIPGASAAIPSRDVLGGKGSALGRLRDLAAKSGFEVPRFIVLTAEFLRVAMGEAGAGLDAAQRREMIACLPIPESLRREAESALRDAGLSSVRLAVRSSAAAEDSASRSYAGLFTTVLGVRFDPDSTVEFWNAVRRVWASTLEPRVLSYAEGEAIPRMAVVVQEMVEPLVSGVAFSIEPVGGRADMAVVSAVLGLGEGLVSGELDADSYWVRFDGETAVEVRSQVVNKRQAIRSAAGGGTEILPVAADQALRPALSDDEARRVASCARALERVLGAPQDIEWALMEEAGTRRLIVLQARPITTLLPPSERRVWDNSNIIESYPGVTSPLTFSFARGVYEEVYRQFCRLLGIGEETLESYRPVFAHMLGHVRGRVYYDLLNWYRTLALLPGYQLNQEFMERMMGVRERLENPPAPPAAGSRASELMRLARTAFLLLRAQARLSRDVPAFLRRVDRALAPVEGQDVEGWPAERALSTYQRLQDDLLHNWRVPIVNDFFAMVHFGILCRLTEKWLPTLPASVVNDLLCGETGIRSTEPSRRVMRLAQRVQSDAALTRVFAETPDDGSLWRELRSNPAHAAFLGAAQEYLREYGDRCVEELKLETVPPSAEPAQLVGVVRSYVRAGLFDGDAGREREKVVRATAEREVAARLRGLRRWAYGWILARARHRVRDRENLRFERTRVFGAVRRLFVCLGHRMAEQDALDAPRDVFHLTTDEIFAFFENRGPVAETRALARERRAQFAAYVSEPAPPARFETVGTEPSATPAAIAGVAQAGDLRGIGCCPGVVRAPVAVVRDPSLPVDLEGRILVAERTDPGWTLIFPLARGLLVERGSLLSHSAIVAREIGLPCIVGVPGLLDSLADDETVEMDGSTGSIRRAGA